MWYIRVARFAILSKFHRWQTFSHEIWYTNDRLKFTEQSNNVYLTHGASIFIQGYTPYKVLNYCPKKCNFCMERPRLVSYFLGFRILAMKWDSNLVWKNTATYEFKKKCKSCHSSNICSLLLPVCQTVTCLLYRVTFKLIIFIFTYPEIVKSFRMSL